MRIIYSYARLLFASWLFIGGLAVQSYPSAASTERDARWRERHLQTIPTDQRVAWVEEQDNEDSRAQGAVRGAGVLVGGFGFAVALNEAAFLSAWYRQRRPAGKMSQTP